MVQPRLEQLDDDRVHVRFSDVHVAVLEEGTPASNQLDGVLERNPVKVCPVGRRVHVATGPQQRTGALCQVLQSFLLLLVRYL